MATRRALIAEADMRRLAKVAREQGVPLCVELPNGTKVHFGGASKTAASNPLDEMFG